MRVVHVPRYGGPEVLELAERPTPVAGAGEVLVRVLAAGVNPFDYKRRQGWLEPFYPASFPYVPGSDLAGEVAALGAGVTSVALGARVYGQIAPAHGGTYAEFVAVDARLLRVIPHALSFLQAAAVPLPGITAWMALCRLGEVRPGGRVLVHAAAGGVGTAAVQIARHAGAWVAATCGGRHVEFVRGLGADLVVDDETDDFRSLLRDIDVAVDVWGGDTNLRTFDVMRPGGTIVVVLRNDPVEMANRERLSALHGVGVKVVMFETLPEALDAMAPMLASGALAPHVAAVFPLSAAAEAQRLIETRGRRGRVVLDLS